MSNASARPGGRPAVPSPSPPAEQLQFPSCVRVEPFGPFSERWRAKEHDHGNFVAAWNQANQLLFPQLGCWLPDALAADWQASWARDVFRLSLPQHPSTPWEEIPVAVASVDALARAIRYVHPRCSSPDALRFWAYTLPDDPGFGEFPTVEEIKRYRPELDPRPGPDDLPADRSRYGQYDQRQFFERAGFLLGTSTDEDWCWLRRLAYRTDPHQRIWDAGETLDYWAGRLRITIPILSLRLGIGYDSRVDDPSTPFEFLLGLVQNWCIPARDAVGRIFGASALHVVCTSDPFHPNPRSVPTPKSERGRTGRKAGRKPTDPKFDGKVAGMWGTGTYPTYADLAQKLRCKAKDVERALNRHRKAAKREAAG
jgi:hypothetical protein